MATGFFDSNGIWNYGEDDNIALFSDTLNKLADSTSDAFTADRNRISTLEAGSLAGSIPIVPTSVVVATGTAAVNNIGTVTYTGATSLSLNGVFTSSYRNYRVIMWHSNSVASIQHMRLRAAGTDVTANNYYTLATSTTQAGSSAAYVSAATGLLFLGLGSNADGAYGCFIDITRPQDAARKTFAFNSTGYNSTAGGLQSQYGGAELANTTACDGFTIFPSAGNFTGWLTVYGYND